MKKKIFYYMVFVVVFVSIDVALACCRPLAGN